MSATRALVTIPLASGVNTGIDPKIAPNGVLTNVENGRITRQGSIQKRNGYEKFTRASDSAAAEAGKGVFLTSKDGVLYSFLRGSISGENDNTSVYRYNELTQQWVEVNNFPSLTYELIGLRSGTKTRDRTYGTMGDVAVLGDYVAIVMINDDNEAVVNIYNWRTWELLYSFAKTPDGFGFNSIDELIVKVVPKKGSAVTNPSYAPGTNAFYVLYYWRGNRAVHGDSSKYTVDRFCVDTGDNAQVFDVDNINYLAFGGDISESTVSEAVFAYRIDASTIRVARIKSDITRQAADTSTTSNVVAVQELDDQSTGTRYIALAYEDGTPRPKATLYAASNLSSVVFSASNITTTTGASANISIGSTSYDVSGTEYIIFCVSFDSPAVTSMEKVTFGGAHTPPNISPNSGGILPAASKIFQINSGFAVMLVNDDDLVRTYYAITSDNLTPIQCKILGGYATDKPDLNALGKVVDLGGDKYICHLPQSRQIFAATANIINTAVVFDLGAQINALSIDGTLLIYGGLPHVLEKNRIFPINFRSFLESLTLSAVTSGTGDEVAAGTYNYKAVQEIIAENGDLYRSAPSPAKEITLGTTAKVSISASETDVGNDDQSDNEKTVSAYRTTNGGSSLFYRVPTYVQDSSSSAFKRSLPAYDRTVDATISGYPQLYTQGGIPENIMLGHCYLMASNADRVFAVTCDDRRKIYISKPKQAGIGVEFAETLTKRIESGEDITALGFIDDKKIVFTENQIYYFVGQGPTENGTGAYSQAFRLSVDMGCVDGSKIAETSRGIFFKSKKGIRLLTRDLQILPVGDMVADYDSFNIKGALTTGDEEQVLFVLDNNDTVLVYDYGQNQWFEWKNYSDIVAATTSDGNLCWIDKSGFVYRETPEFYSDAGQPIRMRIKTAWLSLAGINGHQRIRWFSLLGSFKNHHKLTVRVYYDYNDDEYDTVTLDTKTSLAPATNDYRFRSHLMRTRSTAIRFEIYDSDDTTDQGNYAINAIVLEASAEEGLDRMRTKQNL